MISPPGASQFTAAESLRLEKIQAVLVRAVMAGAAAVIGVRRSGELGTRLKTASELVTAADECSDAAILSVFLTELTAIDRTISFHLEESGRHGEGDRKWAGADPLDGTNHFACGGNLYAVQAHYVEAGLPLAGVVFQPEVYLPLSESPAPVGRLATAIRGGGATVRRSRFVGGQFRLRAARPIERLRLPRPSGYVACVPFSGKMSEDERQIARRVHDSGLIAVTTGAGGAAANVMMAIFGGHHVYANFGAGEDLDLIPPQVIAIEAGLTVWGTGRRPPVWNVRKQPFIVAPDHVAAEQFLAAAGL
jgi:3'-phosphoadenosine 5'-phosphosulfate (PAPS) 3'-phosphatase